MLTSPQRFEAKTNVQDLVDALEIVSRLQGKSYEWKAGASQESSSGGNRVIGLIAQEVQKVLPEVKEDSFKIVNLLIGILRWSKPIQQAAYFQ